MIEKNGFTKKLNIFRKKTAGEELEENHFLPKHCLEKVVTAIVMVGTVMIIASQEGQDNLTQNGEPEKNNIINTVFVKDTKQNALEE
jgi:hypothetical protein